MKILRVLVPKNEGKFSNLNVFSIEDKIFMLNKDIIREFIIKFIGKREKIYAKSTIFTKFNTCLNSLCYLFFIITKSPRCFIRFWHYFISLKKSPLMRKIIKVDSKLFPKYFL